MTNSAQKPPSSVVIQPAQVQESAPSQPTLAGQVKAIPANQIVLQQGSISNGMANSGLVLGIFGVGSILLGPLTEGATCFVGWLFGLLGIIFGHIGAAKGKQFGIGRVQGIIGLTLGYITLALYVAPVIFLLIVFESGW
tara:strand:+ start:26610 stop:27026 length:417 start_codon:yes stop_codon:yes gene_type:complete